MQINVNGQHLEFGNIRDARAGAISLAITEALDLTPGRVSVVTTEYAAWIRIFPTPFSPEHSLHIIPELRPVIQQMEETGDVEPFSFELPVNEEHVVDMAHGWNVRRPVSAEAQAWVDKTHAKLGLTPQLQTA